MRKPNEWECLAFGTMHLSPMKRLSPWRIIRAARTYVRAVLFLRRHGIKEGRSYLQELTRDFKPLPVESAIEAERYACRVMPFLRLIGRILREEYRTSMYRDFSKTASLIALGLKAQLVVGKQKLFMGERNPLTSWVVLEGDYEEHTESRTNVVLELLPRW